MTTANLLLQHLLNASEKAANIARVCRKNPDLLNLLVEEKSNHNKETRFVKDFKTLADVLIQETIKHDVGLMFPELKSSIKGEESNTFTNSLGDSIEFDLSEDENNTKELLLKVLDGNDVAAGALAEEIHKSVICNLSSDLPQIDSELNLSECGIWIDPIDGTAEYIHAKEYTTIYPKIPKSGLKCATVLIGLYSKETKLPLIGVINQPFHTLNETSEEYEGKIFWGLSINDLKQHNIEENDRNPEDKLAIISFAEEKRAVLQSLGYKTVASAGAGHKILKVIEGDVNVYFLSKGSTYKWDTCAGQAILLALGGGVINLRESMTQKKIVDLSYGEDENNCNVGGLVAFRSQQDVAQFNAK